MSNRTQPNDNFRLGCLYVVAFAQAVAPHVGLIIPLDTDSGALVHIRVDRATSPHWQYQNPTTPIPRAPHAHSTYILVLRAAAEAEPAPANDKFGECAPWVWQVIQRLLGQGNLSLMSGADIPALAAEFDTFVSGNRAFATRTHFSNCAVSQISS
ncbi:hypothetical protein BKA62DRAFT_751166 [Auriculariales sp. MPI-PUGE-AT-0066]|nr:hypothetical protein BKA62DRAFT_752057 [Auriculariales sp. MPI-PUGE-AT-0066]KAH7097594.1 hypothetical protein BKA62DRAFT_751166 [Auriculariales sp. MPI-PUGE-AT-0066]